jgi:hypothetical protein
LSNKKTYASNLLQRTIAGYCVPTPREARLAIVGRSSLLISWLPTTVSFPGNNRIQK